MTTIVEPAEPTTEAALRTPDVAIIGGGISGIGTTIELAALGYDTLILERSAELGGTWRDNTYPGCACDVPSALYSFAFAPNPDWSRVFAGQAEIQEYVLGVARRHGVVERTSFATEVTDARWDGAAQRWRIATTTGPVEARFLVIAAGPLHEPIWPDVPGIETFAGTAFHSSRWDHTVDLTGRSVAVIGTGASAVQFIPIIQPKVGHLTIFQRTPSWVAPKPDRRTTRVERALYRRFPVLQRWNRAVMLRVLDRLIRGAGNPDLARRVMNPVGRWNIRRAIKDPALRRALTPAYVFGCKRPLVSNTYYPALARPNVTVVPLAVREVRPHSVVDADGVEHEADTIIYSTGFHVTDLPIAERVHGADGRSLAEVWAGHPNAFMGTSISGFPNAFMLFGPNIGTASAFTMLEAQLAYLTDGLRKMEARGLASVDVRPEVQDQYNRLVQDGLSNTVWTVGGCTSYYLDGTGRNAAAYPWTMTDMKRRLARFPLESFTTETARQPTGAG